MWHVQDVEAAVAAALWVPYTTSQPAEAVGAATATGSDGSTPKDTTTVDVECGKQDLEAATSGAAGGAAAEAPAAAAVPAGLLAAVAHHLPAAQRKRSRLGPYVKNAVTLLALGSSLAAWATYAKGVVEALSGLPAALSSRAAFKQGAQWHCALIRCREGVGSCVRMWAHSSTAQPQQTPLFAHPPAHGPLPQTPLPLLFCSAAPPEEPVCLQAVAGPLPVHDGYDDLLLEGGPMHVVEVQSVAALLLSVQSRLCGQDDLLLEGGPRYLECFSFCTFSFWPGPACGHAVLLVRSSSGWLSFRMQAPKNCV